MQGGLDASEAEWLLGDGACGERALTLLRIEEMVADAAAHASGANLEVPFPHALLTAGAVEGCGLLLGAGRARIAGAARPSVGHCSAHMLV